MLYLNIFVLFTPDRRSILAQANSLDMPSTSSSLRETRIDNTVRLERRNSSNSANFRALGPRLKHERIQEDKLNANNQDVSVYTINLQLHAYNLAKFSVHCGIVARDAV